jgi:hypothetical protein
VTPIRWHLHAAWMIVALLGFAAPAAAQPSPSQDDLRPGEIQRMFDDVVLRQARQRLALAPAQLEPFTIHLRALQMVRRRTVGERARLLGELARLSRQDAGSADESVLAARLEELDEFDARQGAELRRAYRELDATLTVTQRAQFRLLEEQLERRKLELITRARQGARPPGSRF